MTNVSSYLFIFGRTPSLSLLELQACYPNCSLLAERVVRVDGPLIQGTADSEIHYLGGTVKIADFLGYVSALTPETLNPFLDEETHQIDFGISVYGEHIALTPLLKNMKQKFVEDGKSARFFVPKEQDELSSVVVSKNHVSELIVVQSDGRYAIGRTCAVQDFEEWGNRDHARPYADPQTGMLPPKVARMMVNIALGSLKNKEQRGKILLDPFCGMGTILAEGLLSGCYVMGSDQSEHIVDKAKKNLEWLVNDSRQSRGTVTAGIDKKWKLIVSDATHVSENLGNDSVDAIVTEPFMGSTQFADSRQKFPDISKIKDVLRGLEKLYIGCLRDWKKTLKAHGVVVMILPEYVLGGRFLFVKNVVDMCENLGYTVLAGPIEYSRPQALVHRKIYVFQKKSTHEQSTNLLI